MLMWKVEFVGGWMGRMDGWIDGDGEAEERGNELMDAFSLLR